MDKNHDGVVTIDEFLDCCRCDQAITNSMLVFDSTIWPRREDEMDGNRRKFTSSLSSQKARDELQKNQHNRRQPQQKERDPISSRSAKLNVHSTPKHNGNESTKSKLYDNQSHKNLSPSFGENSKRNGPTMEQQQQQQYHHNHPLTVFGNKTKNNVGHKASQTKRIQLSTAAKRCKSINRSNAVDNNNSKAINLDDICKADEVEDKREEVDDEDDNCVAVVSTPNQRHNIDVDTVANNSTQSSKSPTLVKVKTWYTESTVSLPTSSQGVIFWYWTFLFPFGRRQKLPFFIHFTDDDDKEVNLRQFYDLWHLLTSLFHRVSFHFTFWENFFFLSKVHRSRVSIVTARW